MCLVYKHYWGLNLTDMGLIDSLLHTYFSRICQCAKIYIKIPNINVTEAVADD